MERKLATIERISEIHPIPDADAIERCVIRGWNVVSRKDEFKVNDLVIYCEIDSIMPEREEFEFLRSKKFRIRTCKFRGQISQGIAFPLEILLNTKDVIKIKKSGIDAYTLYFDEKLDDKSMISLVPGIDVTDILGVTKYDPPMPACLGGTAKGRFPSHSIKTDEERCIHEDTLIKTDKGNIKISEIVKNSQNFKVLSFNHDTEEKEFNKIIEKSMIRNNNDWYKIYLEDKSFIILTANHKIFLPSLNMYREVKDLQKNDKILKLKL